MTDEFDLDEGAQAIPRGPGRVLDVLTAVTDSSRPLSGGEIATRLGIPRSTTSLLLRALAEREAISIDPKSGMYVPGPLLFKLGYALSGNAGPVRLARPVLERLAEQTTEDVYIGVRSGLSVVYLDKVEGPQSLHLSIELGVGRMMHCTALGKLFLAHDEALVTRLIAERGLPAMTAKTITDPESLDRELTRIRANDYAISNGENVEGIMSLCAPVKNSDGDVIAGISISCIAARGVRMKKQYLDWLAQAARDVDALLRLPPSSGSDA